MPMTSQLLPENTFRSAKRGQNNSLDNWMVETNSDQSPLAVLKIPVKVFFLIIQPGLVGENRPLAGIEYICEKGIPYRQ